MGWKRLNTNTREPRSTQVCTRAQSTRANLLCQVASSVGRIEDFVIKYGKVERQSEPDRVGGLHFGLGNIVRLLIRLSAVFGHG